MKVYNPTRHRPKNLTISPEHRITTVARNPSEELLSEGAGTVSLGHLAAHTRATARLHLCEASGFGPGDDFPGCLGGEPDELRGSRVPRPNWLFWASPGFVDRRGRGIRVSGLTAFCPPLWGNLLVWPRASFRPGLHISDAVVSSGCQGRPARRRCGLQQRFQAAP